MQVKALDNVDNHELTPPYFRYLVHLIRPFPNFDFFFIRPLRQKAVRLLQLKPGERVLDVGCGPGGSLPYLVDAVGSSGEVVGIEISPEVAINARRRIEKNRWRNVLVIEADASYQDPRPRSPDKSATYPRKIRVPSPCCHLEWG